MRHSWESIRAEVLRRIRAREWPPGALIPGEEDLAAEFGAARATVNRAMRELAASGVIERRRRAGTRVALAPVRRAVLEIPVLRHEVEARGEAYAYRLIRQALRPLEGAMAGVLGLEPGTPAIWIEALHLAGTRPLAHETRWLNPAALGQPAPDFAAVSANEWLVAHVPYHEGQITFSAASASQVQAEILGLGQGAPLFITERITFAEGRPITWVRLAHAPGYRLQAPL